MADRSTGPQEWFNKFVQIGVIVENLDETIRTLSEVFGMGPFRTIEWPPAGRENLARYYRGVRGDFTARMAFTDLGPIELELIQPLDGRSIWKDFLDEHGPGLHHIRFNVNDLEPVLKHLESCRIGIAQMGDGVRPGTLFANLDTESKIGFGIEVFKALAGTDGRTPRSSDHQPKE